MLPDAATYGRLMGAFADARLPKKAAAVMQQIMDVGIEVSLLHVALMMLVPHSGMSFRCMWHNACLARLACLEHFDRKCLLLVKRTHKPAHQHLIIIVVHMHVSEALGLLLGAYRLRELLPDSSLQAILCLCKFILNSVTTLRSAAIAFHHIQMKLR